jgi:hypothetical protein
MTREHAKHCLDHRLTVEDPNDENYRTGLIQEIVNAVYCIVLWDDSEGSMTIDKMRDLAVQYPEQLGAA